jgi:Glycine cleavage T-protein C-terminal barrel domain
MEHLPGIHDVLSAAGPNCGLRDFGLYAMDSLRLDADAPSCAPVLLRGENVGLVTSGGWSFTLNKSVVLAYVRCDLATPGTKLEIEVFGARCTATVGREPLYNLRMGVCAPGDDESKIFDQSERVVDCRMSVSRRHRVADAEELKSSVFVVNARLGSAPDQIPIVNRAKVR